MDRDEEHREEEHRRDVARIRGEWLEWLKRGEAAGSIAIANNRRASNTVRENRYKSQKAHLSIEGLNRVISVDRESRAAVVEPKVTMEKLARATLPLGLVPAVLPEFKSITVGGAINGTALESSSHKYGQFNDICLEYEILLGDGSVVTASALENEELFYGISGCYGTLGIILSAKIALVEASEWVELEYHHFHSTARVVDFLSEQQKLSEGPEFLEAIVYGKEEAVAVTGRPLAPGHELKSLPTLSLGRAWDTWYYQAVKEGVEAKKMRVKVRTEEYLFRQDRAAFWMGGYALHPVLLARYIMELIGRVPSFLKPGDISKYNRVKMAPSWFRYLFGWMMKSERLYHIMHRGTEQWFAKNFSIQDYYLPADAAAQFTEAVIDRYEILPIWLCPMKGTKCAQIFSPHYLDNGGSPLLFDVGVYGMAKGGISGVEVVSDLDRLARELSGRKMLYSHSYFTKKEFWEIYPKEEYDRLRSKYFAKEAFLDITEKVLTS